MKSALITLVVTAAALAAGAALAHGPAKGVDVTPAAIGGLRVGYPLVTSREAWGRPDATLTHNGIVSLRWRNADGMLAYVRARGGRVVSIEVGGPVFRTRRGDGYGTSLSLFRRHWPTARRYPSAGSAAATHWAVAGARVGTVLVFTFVERRGLTTASLMTREHFAACYLSECA